MAIGQRSVLVMLATCVLAGAAEAQMPSDDLFLGTWRLNVERSVYTPGPRPATGPDQYQLRQYTALEDGWYRFVLSGRNAEGNPTFQIGVYRLDGQRHPVYGVPALGALLMTGQPSNPLTRSYRVIDQNTVEFTTYTDGVPGNPSVRSVAPDGTTFVQVTEGTNALGMPFRTLLLFERVD